MPQLSKHIKSRQPSPIRRAQILFLERKSDVPIELINLSIGNISLPMHPKMQERLKDIGHGHFKDGVVKYSPTRGLEETRQAYLNLISSMGGNTEGLHVGITDGGSMAMELMILGICGPGGGESDRPLLLIDPSYTNYVSLAKRVGAQTVSLNRILGDDEHFEIPNLENLSTMIKKHNVAGIVVIPADNPTGQGLGMDALKTIAQSCVDNDIWLCSDEAYRGLRYVNDEEVSIWRIEEKEVPGIKGRRISIESASKMFNACGLRIGALVTDNQELHEKCVFEYTANLSPNMIGQYIFGALAHESHTDLRAWYAKQRGYYSELMHTVITNMRQECPGIIISQPEASLYSVIDLRNLVPANFNSQTFVEYCATQGLVEKNGQAYTLLTSPMGGFYTQPETKPLGRTQLRMAFVEPKNKMMQVPWVFKALLDNFLATL